ncbi:RNA polymerase I-specific transcription initiation factor RRN6-like protein [Aspergillus unguis]
MDENLSRTLQYGHLGKAVYNSEAQSWRFLRNIAPPPRISYTGTTATVIQSPSTSVERSSTSKQSVLSQGYPELIAGYHLARNETLSHTLATANEVCNSATSALLDFGRALDVDVDTSGRRAVYIAAFASGECGNIISFRTIADHTVELDQLPTIRLRVPTIGDEDCIDWSTDGLPIRQICFSHVLEERATFLAVRFSSTFVFRPLYRRTPVSVSTQRFGNATALHHQVSRLDPNFLLEISTSHTAHADVKFNPWNQNQLAIVDEDGNWGLWELRSQHKRGRDNWIATCVTSSSLPSVGFGESQDPGDRGRHDGWLAIEWVRNSDHLVVCDRRSSMLYQIKGNQAYPYSMELGFKRQSEWILGVKRSTRNSSHIFVLTTLRLVCFDVNPETSQAREDTDNTISPRAAWRHFRDADDVTLQLTSLTVDEDFYLVLFSRLNDLVLAFHYSEPAVGSNDSESVPDPFILHVPPSTDHAEDLEGFNIGTHFSTLTFKEVAPTTLGGQSPEYFPSYVKLFAVDSSLRVRESLFSKYSTTIGTKPSRGSDVLRVRNLRLTGLQKKTLGSRSGFIVDDWTESAHGNGLISDLGIDSIAPLAVPQFTLDYTQIYAIATGAVGSLSREDEKPAEHNFQESLGKLLSKVSDNSLSEILTSQTAVEILCRCPAIDDIDQNAQDLANFVSQSVSNHAVLSGRDHILLQQSNLFTRRPVQQETPSDAPKLDLVAIYDQLVNNWLIDLSPDIPGRVRISKEKTIRRFVAEIAFSCIILMHKSVCGSGVREGELPSVYPGGPAKIDGQSSYESFISSAEQELQPQTITASTQSGAAPDGPGDPGSRADKRPLFEVLSSYTNFERPGTTSQDAERILDHWKPGTDPASFSLISGESRLAASSRSSRRKSRRNMSQSMKNMNLDSSVPLPATSPAPVKKVDWGSQPDNSQPPMIRLQSSQVTDDLPMTQVERGAFGGRDAARKSGIKARKKKRAAGF